jgi:hypothetical protein
MAGIASTFPGCSTIFERARSVNTKNYISVSDVLWTRAPSSTPEHASGRTSKRSSRVDSAPRLDGLKVRAPAGVFESDHYASNCRRVGERRGGEVGFGNSARPTARPLAEIRRPLSPNPGRTSISPSSATAAPVPLSPPSPLSPTSPPRPCHHPEARATNSSTKSLY